MGIKKKKKNAFLPFKRERNFQTGTLVEERKMRQKQKDSVKLATRLNV